MNGYAIGIDINGKESIFNTLSVFSTSIMCFRRNLISLKIYDSENILDRIYCYDNVLTSFEIIGGKNIKRIECDGNNLKKLDLSTINELEYLMCDIELENKIKENKIKDILFL